MKAWLDKGLARDAAVMIASNGLAGLLFMAVHMVGGRWMPPTEYSAWVSLLGLLWIILVPSAALQVAMARYAAEYYHASETELWVRLFWSAVRVVTVVGALGVGAWTLAAAPLQRALNAPSAGAVWWLGLIAWMGLYSPIVSGTLQGTRRFGWMAAAALAPGLVRFGLAVPVARAGGGALAMMAVYAASVLAGIGVGAWPIRRVTAASGAAARLDLRPFGRYFLPVAGGQLLLYALMNLDLLFSPRLLGGDAFVHYGKSATLARSVLFLPMPLVLAMFPRAVVSPRRRMLLQPAAMALGLSVGLAAAVSLFPGLALRLMYGVSGDGFIRLLRPYAWAGVPLAMTTVLSQYLWARHATRPLAWLAPIAVAYAAGLWFTAPGRPDRMIGWLAAASSAAVAVLAIQVLGLWRRGSP